MAARLFYSLKEKYLNKFAYNTSIIAGLALSDINSPSA
jgi:hypothetical protein